ncbi:hypothetical protein Tco_1256704 [Tanacetum coccineum]
MRDCSKTNEVNIEKPKSVHESVVPKPKINRDKVIIKDWNLDDEDDVFEVTQLTLAKNMTTTGTRVVVNTGKGKMDNALKKSRWVWRPKGNYMDHESKEKGSFILKKFKYRNPEIYLQDHAVLDSGCSSHMTCNKAYLLDYEDYNRGFVAFRSDPKGGKITGKGKIRTVNLDFDDVYFVDELKFNLFAVSQMCDKKNSVLFTDTECLIFSPSFKLLDENQVVLRAPRQNGVYSLDLKNIVPSGENQVNVAARYNKNIMIARFIRKGDKESTQEYILLLLHPQRPRILVEDVDQVAQEKHSENSLKDNDVQESGDVADKEEQHMLTEAEQVLQDDLERMIAQECAAKAIIGYSPDI